MGWPVVSFTRQSVKWQNLVPEFHILLGSNTYKCQKGKEDTREVAEQEALDQRDYLELRVDFIRLNLFSKPQQEDKDKALYLTSFWKLVNEKGEDQNSSWKPSLLF